VLTGYNTDIEFGGVTYHVQTEDRGGGNPAIESLVYVRGEILVARRTDYRNLLEAGAEKLAIQTLMERQHRAILEAIRSGRIDVLTEPQVGAEADTTVRRRSPIRPARDNGESLPPLGRSHKTLDEVIAEWLAEQQRTERLHLDVEGGGDICLGAPFELDVRIRTTPGDVAVTGAVVIVRFLSTATKPVKLAEGTSDATGYLRLTGDVPELERGTALLVVTAQHSSGSDEAKFLVKR
jgi:hypothetical protein